MCLCVWEPVDQKMDTKKNKEMFHNRDRKLEKPLQDKNLYCKFCSRKRVIGIQGTGWSASDTHSNVMHSSLPLFLKSKVWNQCILPLLTYGSETWLLAKGLEKQPEISHRKN